MRGTPFSSKTIITPRLCNLWMKFENNSISPSPNELSLVFPTNSTCNNEKIQLTDFIEKKKLLLSRLRELFFRVQKRFRTSPLEIVNFPIFSFEAEQYGETMNKFHCGWEKQTAMRPELLKNAQTNVSNLCGTQTNRHTSQPRSSKSSRNWKFVYPHAAELSDGRSGSVAVRGSFHSSMKVLSPDFRLESCAVSPGRWIIEQWHARLKLA